MLLNLLMILQICLFYINVPVRVINHLCLLMQFICISIYLFIYQLTFPFFLVFTTAFIHILIHTSILTATSAIQHCYPTTHPIYISPFPLFVLTHNFYLLSFVLGPLYLLSFVPVPISFKLLFLHLVSVFVFCFSLLFLVFLLVRFLCIFQISLSVSDLQQYWYYKNR